MNSSGNIPDIDPADEDSLVGAFRFVVNKMLQDSNGQLPAKIISFDRTTNRAQVQPLIAIVTTDGTQISRAQIASIPVLQIGGGNFMLNFNLLPGDLGWIRASDRDISLFLQSYSEEKPNTNRINSFSDSIFIPAIMKDYTIAAEDAEHAVLQNLAGTVRIALWPDKVKITAPAGLVVDGPITATGGISVSGGSGITMTGGLTMTGTMRVVGDITASGDITPHVP